MNSHITIMKILCANALTFFVKANTLHFLVKGYNFQECHLKTEDFYNHYKEVYDWLNERLIQLGSTPLVSLKEAMEKATLTETNESTKKVNEVYSIIIEDFNILKALFKKLKIESANNADFVTEDYCIGQLRYLDKEMWFIQSKLVKDL